MCGVRYQDRTGDSGITTRGFTTKLTAPYRNTLDLQPTCGDQPTFNLHRSCVQSRVFLHGASGRNQTPIPTFEALYPIRWRCLVRQYKHTKYLQIFLHMNPYTQLDIPVDASLEEIKQRFRTLAHLHHPDKGGNEEVFKSIKLAYEILMDPIRRKQYDLTGDAEIANIRDEAVTNIVQIILSIIPTFDPDQDDLIEIAKHKTKDMLTRENNQIANIQRDINNFEKVLTKLRIKNNGENILHNVIVNQIRDQRKDLLQNQQNVQVCTLMLEILNDYEYGAQHLSFEILPDNN
jgi:hypothetical protein